MTLAGLVARNLGRNTLRSVLTAFGVAVAVLGFVVLRAAVASWTMGADFAVADRVVTRNKVTLAMPLPRRYAANVAQIPHVRVATHGTWLAGRDPRRPDEFFATVAVDHTTYFDVFDEAILAPDEKAAWLADRRGAVVGDVLAKRFGWKVGDRVTLESGVLQSETPGAWTFTIRAIYGSHAKSMDRSTMLVRWDYVNDALSPWRRDRIGWILSRVDAPGRSAEVSLAIDRAFAEDEMPTVSQDEATFRTSLLGLASTLLRALDVVSVTLLGLLVLLLGNTIAMAARERVQENAVLRTLGFAPLHVAALVVGEAMLLATVGAATGLAMAYALLFAGLARYFEENTRSFFPYFQIGPALALTTFAVVVALGAVAAAIPAYGAARLRVVDALRRVA
jgi:putative ABC transport system permease protein